MSTGSTTETSSTKSVAGGMFGDPGAIAPSVDKGWRDEFILELRLLSVPGDAIGDALMTVETHVAESGEGAQEAFGDPTVYAREIAEATGTAGRGPVVGPRTVVSNVLGLLGLLLATNAFPAWLEGGAVEVTTGGLVSVALLLLVVGTLFLTRTLRGLVEHPRLAVLLIVLLIAVMVGSSLLLPERLLTLPAVPLIVLGALLVVVDAVLTWFDHDVEDLVRAPGEGSSPRPVGRIALTLLMPVGTLALMGLSWVLHAFA